MDDMVEADPSYSCELDEDYSRVVYRYDENIDGILQAKVLLSLTTSYALKGIMETGNPDWHIHAEIVNCHTGSNGRRGNAGLMRQINFGPVSGKKAMSVQERMSCRRKLCGKQAFRESTVL